MYFRHPRIHGARILFTNALAASPVLDAWLFSEFSWFFYRSVSLAAMASSSSFVKQMPNAYATHTDCEAECHAYQEYEGSLWTLSSVR